MRVQEGDERYGERCELAMANTKPADIDRVGGSRVLFHNGTESWIAQQIMLDPKTFAFCGTECSLDYDGGLVQQLKQIGACGTPANGIVARDLPGTGVVLEHRNSAENDCGNATMKSLWRVPIQRGKWIRILQHVRWSPDEDTGYIATWINGRPVEPSLDGNAKQRHPDRRRGPDPHLDAQGRPQASITSRSARPTRARTCAAASTATRGSTATASCTWTAPRLRRRGRWRRRARVSNPARGGIPRSRGAGRVTPLINTASEDL